MTLDPTEGERLKQKALVQVYSASDPAWNWQAVLAGKTVARENNEFTADDIWERLEKAGVSSPKEPRAMGPIMRALETAGICSITDRTIPSARPGRHRGSVRVWKSNIYVSKQSQYSLSDFF